MLKRQKVLIDGEWKKIAAERICGRLWIHVDGQTWNQETDEYQSSARVRISGGGNHILAPMPGKILKVNVQEGDRLPVGTVAIVMEAMKMEYTLKAEINGLVKKLNVKVSDQVALGKVLVEMEPE